MEQHKSCIAVIEKGERHVQVTHIDGGYVIEWARRDAPGYAMTSTKVKISSEAADATLMALVNVMEQVHVEQERADAIAAAAEAVQGDHVDEIEELRRDAERYRKWRDNACYHAGATAKALCNCIAPFEIDSAIDRLP